MSNYGGNEKSRLEFCKVTGTTSSLLCMTFIMKREDHTLGNSLRYIIINWKNVDFCGYSVPHPSLNQINIRIQSNNSTPVCILQDGLFFLRAVSEIILNKF